MNKNISFIATKAASLLLLASFTLVGCIKNLTNETPPLPPAESYFNFETRQTIRLSIDYAVPGFQATFNLFEQNPLQNPETGSLALKDGVEPIYTNITDKDGKFNRDIIIPASVKSVYLYTDRWGLRSCIELNITGNTATYNAAVAGKATTRAASSASDLVTWFNGSAPYLISKPEIMGSSLETEKIYSTAKWTTNGTFTGANNLSTDVFTTSTINDNSIADISKRAQDYLKTFEYGEPRKELLRDAKILNITTKEANTRLNVVYLDEAASYNNTFGYYYYKKSYDPHKLEGGYSVFRKNMEKNINKYVIFPNVAKENGVLTTGTTVALKFYGENGTEIPGGTYDFPEGYVIGWFLNSQGFITDPNNSWIKQYAINNARFNNYEGGAWGNYISSNDKLGDAYANNKDFRRFITLADQKSKTLVIGIEDKVGDNNNPDDYCDLTFLVTSNKDIIDPGLPPIIDVPEEPTIDESFKGTLAFEDLWPYSGDYDMNDVVVEYKWEITINKDGYVSELKETYKPTHYGAGLQDYFAYQLNAGNVALGNGLISEPSTNSVRIDSPVQKCINKEYVVTRTFSTNITRDELVALFNPYIIVTTSENPVLGQGRKEVHLPKKLPTDLIDKSLVNTEGDAYYVDKNGEYSFAINIPVLNFKVATEKSRIDIEYPSFKLWSASRGASNTDWYKNYQPIK